MKYTIAIIIILCLIAPSCIATDINIYYPNDNMTTGIHYSEGANYSFVSANNVSGNFTAVILQNEIEYDDVIESPHKIISPIFSLIMLIILITFLILVTKLIKRVWS